MRYRHLVAKKARVYRRGASGGGDAQNSLHQAVADTAHFLLRVRSPPASHTRCSLLGSLEASERGCAKLCRFTSVSGSAVMFVWVPGKIQRGIWLKKF